MLPKRYVSLFPRLLRSASFDPSKHLEASETSTYAYQEKLPKQPIQPLKASGVKFKQALSALETHPKFGVTEIKRLNDLWDSFEGAEGPEIDKLLREIDAKQKESYVNPLWQAMYLSDRVPLLCNYNPTISPVSVNPNLSQSEQASVMLNSVAKYHCTLRDSKLSPDGIQLGKKFIPLDMSQYKNLLYSTRIPEKGIDRIQQPESGQEPNHACVLHKGYFYKVQVLDNDTVLSVNDINDQLQAILADAEQRGSNKTPVCSLSLTDRDLWAENRQKLVQLGNNQQVLNDIDNAMTLLVLDDFVNKSPSEALEVAVAGPSNNRWPDKSFSLIVNGDSSVGLTFEHAWGDGAAILNIERTIYQYLTKNAPEFSGECKHVEVEPLQFDLDPHLEEQIKNAQLVHEDRLRSFKIRTFETGNAPAFAYPKWFEGEDLTERKQFDLDRAWMKKNKVGPDAFMQISLQLAAADYYGHHVNQYEAASMAMFYKGRTETVRPCTKEVTELYKTYQAAKSSKTNESLVELAKHFRVAGKAHNKQIKECLGAQGFDRHLSALKIHALRNGLQVQCLFLVHG